MMGAMLGGSLSRLRRWSLVEFAAIVCQAGSLGCSQHPKEVARWESEHFVYITYEGEADACRDVLLDLEEHYTAIHDAFDLPPPLSKYTYRKYASHEQLTSLEVCPEGASACTQTDRGMIWSSELADHHELVHAYFGSLGVGNDLLVEGVATALDCEFGPSQAASIDWQTAYGHPVVEFEFELYVALARFVAHIVRSQGPATFVQLYSRATYDMSIEEFELLFFELYGEQAADVWEQSQAEAQVDSELGCLRVWECSLPPDANPRAVAGRCSAHPDFVVAELAEGTWYSLYYSQLSQSVITCEGDPVTDLGTASAGLPSYAFRSSGQTIVIGHRDSLTEVPLHSIDTSSCALASQSPLTSYQGPLHIDVPPGETVYLGHPGLWYHAWNYELSVEGDVELLACSACDDESVDCEPFEVVLDASDTDTWSLLKLVPGEAGGKVHFQ